MVPLFSLWLPIVLSAVIVFFASFVLHMLLPWHKGDYRKLPNEDQVLASLRNFNIPPGDYMAPCGAGPQDMKNPEFLNKLKEGPVAVMTFMKPGPMNMGPQLLQWFIYCLVVGLCSAYVCGHLMGPGAGYRPVFRFVGAVTFIGYSLALWQDSIWYKRNWGTTIRNTIDGLIYGLLTGGVFGWLWPH